MAETKTNKTTKTVKPRKQKTPMEKRLDAEWLDLCAWVEKELFQYDSVTHIKTQAALVLQGLRRGQAVANNNNPTYGDYSYKVIKMAFVMNKQLILDAIRDKDFNDSELQKMKYICAIMRDKIDAVNIRYLNAQKSQEKAEAINTDIFEYQGAAYQSKTEPSETQSKLDKKFEELW